MNAIRNNLSNSSISLHVQNSSFDTGQALALQADCMSLDCASTTPIILPQKLQEFEKNIPFFTDPAKGKYIRNTLPAHVPVRTVEYNFESRNTFGTVQYTTSTTNWNEIINKSSNEGTTTEMQESQSTDGIFTDVSTDNDTVTTDDLFTDFTTESIYNESEETTTFSDFITNVPFSSTANFYETSTENRTHSTSSSTSSTPNQTESYVNITTILTPRTSPTESNITQVTLNFSSTPPTTFNETSTPRELNTTNSLFANVSVTPTTKNALETAIPPMTCRSEGYFESSFSMFTRSIDT